jgi:hypothetical protein
MPEPTDTPATMMRRALGHGRISRMRVATAVGAVVSLGSFVGIGITDGSGFSVGADLIALAILVGIAMTPFIVAGGIRFGPRVFLLALAIAAGLEIFGFVLAQDDSSSTAALAAVVMPFYATLAVVILAGIDATVRRLARRGG